MVAGKSPGWLPAGWKEQVKVTNGRKVKPAQWADDKANSYKANSYMENSYMEEFLLFYAPYRPPIGLTCYVESLTGSKFYSKPQVSEYLKKKKPSTGELFGGESPVKLEASYNMSTLEGASCASEQKQIGISKQSIKKVVIERTIPDGLPTGWIKETKIEKRSGRKDPYYMDPVSGYVFRSVPDALRFLKSGNINKCAIKPRKRDELIFLNEETSGEPANLDHSGHYETKRQLEGSEICVTNKGLGKRHCPSVSSDATILSTAEHWLNNAIEECAETECSNDPTRSPLTRTEGSRRKLRDRVKANNGTDPFAVNVVGITSDRKMLIESTKTKKQAVSLPRRSSKRLMFSNLELSERDLRAAARNAGGNEAKLLVCSAPQKLKTFSKAEIANHVFTGTEAPFDAKQSNRTHSLLKKESFSEDWPVRQGIEEEDEGNVESKILNPVADSWSDPCLDFAVKILTGTIQIEEETKESNDPGSSPLTRNDGCIRNQREITEMVCAENGTVSFPSADMVQEGELAENGMGMTSSRKMQINSGRSKKKEAVSLPRRSSKRLVGLNSNMAVNLPLCQHVPASTKSGESGAAKLPPEALDNMAHSTQFFEPVEGSKKHMEGQAVHEHQPVRQETEKKTEGNAGSQFLYPLEDSWSDSCIEFAVKTLTGEIPIEDNTAIQDFFRQHDDTSHSLPDLGLSNYFQSDILLDFDSTGNPLSGTQLPEIPTFLAPGNVDLTSCGDNAPQQPSLGGKGNNNKQEGTPKR